MIPLHEQTQFHQMESYQIYKYQKFVGTRFRWNESLIHALYQQMAGNHTNQSAA